MELLGLDLASRLSGWTCGDGAEPPVAGAWPFPSVTEKGGADYGLLLEVLDNYLEATFSRFPDIAAVGYEAPILIAKGRGDRQYGDKLSTLRLLYPMGAYVELFCRRRQIPCHEVLVTEAKAEVTGNAHAQKEEVADLAEKCGVILPTVGRLDAGDSWSVWKRLLRAYNPPVSAAWDKRIWTPKGALGI